MEVRPILSALKRNKVGATLVALQIALTLAVVANAMSVIQHHWTDMRRPSGLDEANIFSMANQWVGKPDDLRARVATDVAALRSLPGVVDAEATISFPLSGNYYIGIVRTNRDMAGALPTSLYDNTAHGLSAQGLKLVAGRWFRPDEVADIKSGENKSPPAVVLTAALAKRLFPEGQVLGRSVYIGDDPSRIVGIVERASAAGDNAFVNADYSTFMPFQSVSTYTAYIVRTQPGQQLTVMSAARKRLLEISRLRILDNVQPFSESRTKVFAVAAATSWLLATVCALLLVITACGTIGLTMVWVGQRRSQIGMRRALGARRIDILRYFQTENLLIAGGGALLGIAAGLGANLWLARHLAVTRMSPVYICLGAIVVLILSQLAALWPAVRASTVPPSLAARGL
jgi:putative ABC transport system permease protein